jgi:tRNA(fMet)-specific endonuclease VapC
MKYLLDTNICIYLIKNKPTSVITKFNEHSVGDIGVSTITVAELTYGAKKSQRQAQNQEALLQFLSPLIISEFDANAAFSYGQIRAELESQGTPIGSLDTLIAGHAVSLGVTLVTNNEREFRKVPNLAVENWVEK